MKRTVLAVSALISAIFLASCSPGSVVYENSSIKLPSTGKSWTVLVYMCGGSEETQNGSASKKLQSIMSVDYPDNVNVLIETGGSAEWHQKGVYSDYLQRFEAGRGTLYLADQTLAANMGDYHTLSDFLSWGISNYKADNYMLVLSGSGGGSLAGMCSDELFDGDGLSLAEISYAMSVAGRNFDITGLDASLMGTLETASALGAYTDYIVAPQDTQSADSWNYAGFLNYICSNPSASGADIGRVICDNYYSQSVKDGNEKFAAMSVIDISKISTLNQAFDGMAGDMLTSTDSLDNYINLSNALRRAHVYGGAAADEGFSDLIDLGDAAVRSAEYVGATADRLVEALNDTIVYRVCGENQSGSTGMSFYYPLDLDEGRLQEYMDMSMSSKYREFLRKICIGCSVTDKITVTPDYTSSWAWTTYNNDMSWLEYKTILDGNSYEMNILGNMDLFRDVNINVYKQDKSSGEYVFIGKYRKLESDWEAGIFKDNFDGTLPGVIGKNVSMSLVREYDDYDLYSVPVVLNGERSNIRVRYDRDNDKYDIIGAWDGLDSKGQTSGTIKQLKMSDRITPLLNVYDEEHRKQEYIMGSSGMKLGGGVNYKRIDKGNYIFEYELTDIYGLKRWGTPVKAVFSGGKINFE